MIRGILCYPRDMREINNPKGHRMSTTTRRRFTETAAHDLKARTREEVAGAPPATDKQVAFIERLLEERDISAEHHREAHAKLDRGISKDTASKWITRLLDKPKKARRTFTQADEPDAGMYRQANGTIVRVYLGQRSGKMLLKRVVGDDDSGYSYEYVGQAARCLGDAKPLTLEEAKAWGKMTGHCCVCARRLDNPESVDAGIGPVCASRIEA